jgi:hypothetical protein
MGGKQKGLGRERVLDFSALEDDAPWSPSPRDLTDPTRTAQRELGFDSDPTGELGAPEEVALRTTFSNRAVLIADLLRDTFSRRFFGRSPYRVLRVDEPEGPSTAGGLLARQAISLVARQGSAPSIICGWVDTSKQEAQLRGYESVARRYEAHHGTELDLSAEHYERFLNELVTTLTSGGIKVRVLVLDEEQATPGQAQASASRSPTHRAAKRGWGNGAQVMTFVLGLLAGRVVPWDRVDSVLVPLWSKLSALVGGAPH